MHVIVVDVLYRIEVYKIPPEIPSLSLMVLLTSNRLQYWLLDKSSSCYLSPFLFPIFLLEIPIPSCQVVGRRGLVCSLVSIEIARVQRGGDLKYPKL